MVWSHTTLSGPEGFVPIVSLGWGSGCQLCSDWRGLKSSHGEQDISLT